MQEGVDSSDRCGLYNNHTGAAANENGSAATETVFLITDWDEEPNLRKLGLISFFCFQVFML